MNTALWLKAFWFWWLPLSWGERDEICASYNTASLTDLTEMQLFFLNKCSLDYCKLLISRVMKRLILTIWAKVLAAFMQEQGFEGSDCHSRS